MPTKNCDICGKEFHVFKGRLEIAKYCSYACLGKSKTLYHSGKNHKNWTPGIVRKKVCQQCGIEFEQRKKEPLSSFLNKKFCCKPCADIGGLRYTGKDHPNYKEGTIRGRGRLMEHWGAAVKARDGNVCQHCGSNDGELHAHHIKPWIDYPELRFDVANGITLCPPCHWREHAAQNENAVNSVKPLTDHAEGNTEPSFGRKPVEGVTTRGQAYRRWFGECAKCHKPISKRFSDTIGRVNLFCSKSCSSSFNQAAGKIGRKPKSMAVISSTSPAGES